MKYAFAVTILILLSSLQGSAVLSVFAQGDERQVGIEVGVPVKKLSSLPDGSNFKQNDNGGFGNDVILGGRFHMPVSDFMSLRASIDYQQASQIFLAPTDQMTVSGEAWLYFTGKPSDTNKTWVRPFVFGGMKQDMLVGTTDATQAFGGFGINVSTIAGTRVIPKVHYTTHQLGGSQTAFGQEYNASVELQFDLGKSGFAFGIEPFVARFEPVPGFYATKAGASLIIWRKF